MLASYGKESAMQSRSQVRRHVLRKGSVTPRVDWRVTSRNGATRLTVFSPNGERETSRSPSMGGNLTMYRLVRGVMVCNTLILKFSIPSHSKRRKGILARVNSILGRQVPIQHPQCPDNLGNGEFHLVLRHNAELLALVALQDKNCDVCTLREKF